MARSPSKKKAAVRRPPANPPPQTGHPHPDPLTTEKAEEMLGGEPSPLDEANIPADAAASCTGHALAHVIDCLLHRENLLATPKRVSARMLYEMAKRNDEWNGTTYFGSSVRGAVK